MTNERLQIEIQRSYDEGDPSIGRAALDEWESAQPLSRNILNTLRYYRREFGQIDAAIAAGEQMLKEADDRERVSDSIRLTELYTIAKRDQDAWTCIQNVICWPELRDWYDAGLARQTVECLFGIALNAVSTSLQTNAYETAIQMLDDGCSVSYDLLVKACNASQSLNRPSDCDRFANWADAEKRRIESEINAD